MNYQPTYLGEIDLSEETLTHYGVKGMRWGRRRGKKKSNSPKRKFRRYTSLNPHASGESRGYFRDRSRKDTERKTYNGSSWINTHGYRRENDGTIVRTVLPHSITGDDRQRKRRRSK